MRTNNGGEFCSIKFEQFYKEQGIERHKTTPYTPKQNGVAARMNRTLMEMVGVCLVELVLNKAFGLKL